MPRRFASRADELRHHRKCFELALELGCTPKQAEERMEALQKREELRAWCKTRGLAWKGPENTPNAPSEETFEQFDATWMMRD